MFLGCRFFFSPSRLKVTISQLCFTFSCALVVQFGVHRKISSPPATLLPAAMVAVGGGDGCAPDAFVSCWLAMYETCSQYPIVNNPYNVRLITLSSVIGIVPSILWPRATKLPRLSTTMNHRHRTTIILHEMVAVIWCLVVG